MIKVTNDHNLSVYRIDNDINGNPRYIISWLSLGLSEYKATTKTREAGLSIYRGKQFGGGFVFQSYNLDDSLDYFINKLTEDL